MHGLHDVVGELHQLTPLDVTQFNRPLLRQVLLHLFLQCEQLDHAEHTKGYGAESTSASRMYTRCALTLRDGLYAGVRLEAACQPQGSMLTSVRYAPQPCA
jgi:hypothetical protein